MIGRSDPASDLAVAIFRNKVYPSGEFTVVQEADMLKKLIPLSFAFTLILILSTPIFAQEARWEGKVVRSDKDKSTLTVRNIGGSQEKVIHYDDSTKWVSQEHGSKTVNNIDASQVKDGDRVIVKGTEDKKGGFHATLISKRLTPLAGNTR